ncbi:hypothetical protein EV182_005327, partial [Spiromyces aspiralis]
VVNQPYGFCEFETIEQAQECLRRMLGFRISSNHSGLRIEYTIMKGHPREFITSEQPVPSSQYRAGAGT